MAASRLLQYPPHLMEVIVARGKQPSVQRNAAMRAARGDIIYFLDDDSEPHPDNLARAARHFSDSAVEILGGPNLCPPGAPALEQTFALVTSSWLAFGPSRARYCRTGTTRLTSEKELILCNMAARRATLLAHSGFDESLYPNEENALLDKIQASGGKLLHDPDFFVYRNPRPNFAAFARMLLTYGRGRAEQLRVNPTFGSAPNLIPPLFLAYLLVLPIALWRFGFIAALPLAFYLLALIVDALVLAARAGVARAIAAMPLVFLTHALYGAGFYKGLFTALRDAKSPSIPVTLETVQSLP